MREFVRKKRQYNTHFTSQKFDSHVNSLNFNKLTQQPKFYSVLVGRSTSFLQYSDLLVDRFTLYWSACRQVYTLMVGMSIGLHFVGRQVDNFTLFKSASIYFHTFYLLNRGLSVYCRFIKYLLNRGLSVYCRFIKYLLNRGLSVYCRFIKYL